MNTPRLIIAGVLALAAATVQSADQAEPKVDKKTQAGEARLAQRLEGREAGEPVSCIPVLRPNQLEVIEGVALVYDAGDTIYVARPNDPQTLGRDDVVIIDRHTSQLCNTDVVRTVDRNTGFFTGVVFLGKFAPFKKQN
jgi:hypothetical protein